MKICFVAENVRPSAGLGRMISSIAFGLEKRGHSISYVTSEQHQSSEAFLSIDFRFSPKRPVHLFYNLLRLRRFVKDQDAIVSFDVMPAGILVFLATFGQKKNKIIHCLGTYSLFTTGKRVKNFLAKQAFNKAEKVFIINDFVKAKIEDSQASFKFNENVAMVPVGVDTKLFTKSQTQSVYPEGVRPPYILSVGAIKVRKAQFDSVRAFCSICHEYPELTYVVAGSQADAPSYVAEIKAYVSSHEAEDRVVFLEDITDSMLLKLYRDTTFFVLTPVSSEQSIEGFGMVYVEAALSEKASIGTYGTGAEVAIKDNSSGILVKQGDVGEIAIAMRRLLDDKSLRSKLAQQAYQDALEYDWKHVVDLYEKKIVK